ncbi:hypothetical protein [Marilutibacter spongiae]|uniref:Uncharacterized protein n=1 Tax=Marilutibacter spongiae TaxID=2025720 RepID=A0A7W3TN46_9GAMM|nr:hypothetical protein [Lysobacter spongiae]MBB1061370.1 hypothetical protein [Lysobacter spongiae]
MEGFTARPERIIGNIALASLLAGLPVGLMFSLWAGMQAWARTPLPVWLREVGGGALMCAAVTFLAGLVLVAPSLWLLRRFGLGGPFFVHAVAVLASLAMMADQPRMGLAALALAVPASLVFCRYAYPPTE